jgi:thiol-disulfide isomerase/thioredoxin
MKLKRELLIGLLVLGMLFSLAACAGEEGRETASESPAAEDTQEAPAANEAADDGEEASFAHFTAEDLDGNQVDQEIFSDYKVTMINVWATFCGPCLSEMPELGELAEEYADKGVQIVGIVIDVLDEDHNYVDSQVELARKIVEETGADYRHLLPSEDLIEAKLQEVMVVPMTFFVDSEGNLLNGSFPGAMDKEGWTEIFEKMLARVS